MGNIAFFTVGVFQAPYDDLQIMLLGELLEPIWAAAEAFDFKHAFDEDDSEVRLDKDFAKRLASNL